MSLNEDLSSLLNAGGSSPRFVPPAPSHPSGWEPGVKYDPSGAMTVTSLPSPSLSSEDSWKAAVESLGIEVPEGWRVRLVEAKFDPAAWHRDEQGEDAVTRPVWRYRFAVEPAPRAINVDDLLSSIGKRKNKILKTEGADRAFVVPAGDLQLGKIDGDGTTGTVERFLDKTELAVRRLKDLRRIGRRVDTIYLPWLGDCIEGTQSQGGALAAAGRLDLTLTEQIRIYRRLMLEQVKAFASLAERLVVVAVPGNHDEAERAGGRVVRRYDDSWAIEGAVAVFDALRLADGFDHVSLVVPDRDELVVSLDVAGTPVGFAHGHQFGRDPVKWWSGQAHGMQPIGSTTLLLGAHLHHLRIEQSGAKTFLQIPALDGGSTWWRHKTGQDSPAGMVSLLVGDGGWSDLAVH